MAWSPTPSVVSRFGERAEHVALALARAGCVALEHDYRSGTISNPRRGWTPHPSLARLVWMVRAAEAICDRHQDIAVVWCHGQPPDAVLRLIKQAAGSVDQVVICPDADLGGIRIAARVHDHLVPGARCTVLDIGTVEHVAGDAFSPASLEIIARMAQRLVSK